MIYYLDNFNKMTSIVCLHLIMDSSASKVSYPGKGSILLNLPSYLIIESIFLVKVSCLSFKNNTLEQLIIPAKIDSKAMMDSMQSAGESC